MSRRTTRTTDAGIGSRRRSAGPSQAKGATASYWTTRTTFKTIDSPAERASAIGFFRNVWSQRFNDAKRGHHVIVMQRGHEDDLASLVMERGGFEHLNLPSEYERTPFVIVSGEKDRGRRIRWRYAGA